MPIRGILNWREFARRPASRMGSQSLLVAQRGDVVGEAIVIPL